MKRILLILAFCLVISFVFSKNPIILIKDIGKYKKSDYLMLSIDYTLNGDDKNFTYFLNKDYFTNHINLSKEEDSRTVETIGAYIFTFSIPKLSLVDNIFTFLNEKYALISSSKNNLIFSKGEFDISASYKPATDVFHISFKKIEKRNNSNSFLSQSLQLSLKEICMLPMLLLNGRIDDVSKIKLPKTKDFTLNNVLANTKTDAQLRFYDCRGGVNISPSVLFFQTGEPTNFILIPVTNSPEDKKSNFDIATSLFTKKIKEVIATKAYEESKKNYLLKIKEKIDSIKMITGLETAVGVQSYSQFSKFKIINARKFGKLIYRSKLYNADHEIAELCMEGVDDQGQRTEVVLIIDLSVTEDNMIIIRISLVNVKKVKNGSLICPSTEVIKNNPIDYNYFTYNKFKLEYPTEFSDLTTGQPKKELNYYNEVKLSEIKTFGEVMIGIEKYLYLNVSYSFFFNNCQLFTTSLLAFLGESYVNGEKIGTSTFSFRPLEDLDLYIK